MTEMTWGNRQGHRDRSAWCILIAGDVVHEFTGADIPAVVAVRGSDYRKDGKWSHRTYRMTLAPGVRAITGHDGWETGRFTEGVQSAVSGSGPVDTWSDIARAMGVSVPSAMGFIRRTRPETAAMLDEVDVKMDALDAAAEAAGAVEGRDIVVKFGSPTRRMQADGWWTEPKGIYDDEGERHGEIALKARLENPGAWSWGQPENIEVRGCIGAVVGATHSAGHGGGYASVTVRVAV